MILHRLVAVGRHLGTCVVRTRIFVLVVDHVRVALFSEVHLVLKVVEEGPVNLLLRIRQTVHLTLQGLLCLLKLLLRCTHIVVAQHVRFGFLRLNRQAGHFLALDIVEVGLIATGPTLLHKGLAVLPVSLSHRALLILRQRVEDLVDVPWLLFLQKLVRIPRPQL